MASRPGAQDAQRLSTGSGSSDDDLTQGRLALAKIHHVV
jgi:hypothetical protein